MILGRDFILDEINVLESLIFDGNIYKPSIRRYSEMRDLYIERVNLNEDLALYYMFRNLVPKGLEDIIKEKQIRIDLTVMEAIKIGKEYNKTHGHYHPEAAPGRTFPEIYKVIEGKVCFILQKCENELVEDLAIVVLEKGESIFIPPNYGHVMINIGEDRACTLNIVSSRFIPIYEPYKLFKGAACYLTEKGIMLNNNYKFSTKIRFYKSKFILQNIIEKIYLEDIHIKALNKPYIINDFWIFFEETKEKLFEVLS